MSIAELYQHWDRAETAHEKFVAKRSRRPRLTAIEESQREALCIHAEQSREALARAAAPGRRDGAAWAAAVREFEHAARCDGLLL